MKNQKCIAFILSGLLLTGCLTGLSAMVMTPKAAAMQTESVSSAPEASYTVVYEACEENSAENSDGDRERDRTAFQEQVRLYEPFGMSYDAVKDELRYYGKLVRWFEDYYPIGEEGECGTDFFNENGIVDVHTIRDLSQTVRNPDGSLDPSGKVIGLQQFSDKDFAARDIDAIKNPPMQEALAGDPVSAEERQEIAAEYAAFGVTYDVKSDQWYFQGKKVRYFLDVLISNGKSLSSGDFRGTIRNNWKNGGTVDIYTVRDFHRLNAEGNGTLTDIKEYSRQEFDARTKGNTSMQEISGE